MRIVVALGGNALLRRGEVPEAATQRRRLRPVARQIASLAQEHEVFVVHGNGPQVGLLALETEANPTLSEPYPLGDLVAESQGLIGSWIQQALLNEQCQAGVLITQVVVAADDPAFGAPTKPIGGTYDEQTARSLAAERGWTVRADGSNWRRVVPSPRPVEVLDVATADALAHTGFVVVLGAWWTGASSSGGGFGKPGWGGRAYRCTQVASRSVVGGGIRDSADQLELFESTLNLIVRHAPRAVIAFNRTPQGLVAAVDRGLHVD